MEQKKFGIFKRAKMFRWNFHSLQQISQFMNADFFYERRFSATVFLNNSFHYFRKRK